MASVGQHNQSPETFETTPVLSVTDSAVTVIRRLLREREIPNYVLRVFVAGGGCSGLQYGMRFEEAPQEFDRVVEVEDVRLVVDPTSLMYLQGATIDYIDGLAGGGFRIDNPNEASACGCGHTSHEAAAHEACGCGGDCGCNH